METVKILEHMIEFFKQAGFTPDKSTGNPEFIMDEETKLHPEFAFPDSLREFYLYFDGAHDEENNYLCSCTGVGKAREQILEHIKKYYSDHDPSEIKIDGYLESSMHQNCLLHERWYPFYRYKNSFYLIDEAPNRFGTRQQILCIELLDKHPFVEVNFAYLNFDIWAVNFLKITELNLNFDIDTESDSANVYEDNEFANELFSFVQTALSPSDFINIGGRGNYSKKSVIGKNGLSIQPYLGGDEHSAAHDVMLSVASK